MHDLNSRLGKCFYLSCSCSVYTLICYNNRVEFFWGLSPRRCSSRQARGRTLYYAPFRELRRASRWTQSSSSDSSNVILRLLFRHSQTSLPSSSDFSSCHPRESGDPDHNELFYWIPIFMGKTLELVCLFRIEYLLKSFFPV